MTCKRKRRTTAVEARPDPNAQELLVSADMVREILSWDMKERKDAAVESLKENKPFNEGFSFRHYLSTRLFVQKVTAAAQKAKAGQRDKEALTQLLGQLYKAC